MVATVGIDTAAACVGVCSVVAAVSMFTHTELSDIVLRVVKNVMIPGFIATQSDCPFQLVGKYT